ncbi:FecR domain-containing protein [Pseudomonas putida]|uniref:FecR domain-containing protein n=1 Tax=Pseudomonas putida TaxID=303 RepID=A0A7W2L589_PSEPU|nr:MULTISPECIES: FecR domain-containing protein [Pseudomonas]MBA6118576.1 FecR domain-containing protein [Pseudomonas putida]MBI6945113.1 FecR domain-containing protein [Pseudomonas putida]MBI6961461.1 FecR domain-containing protein [Pseudomonas putida]MCZ9640778.1 FecR domain-containing protein [Pseudomonas putida]MEC4877808.1 FecR domain-containing protein [Pseudomonas sp. NC26]
MSVLGKGAALEPEALEEAAEWLVRWSERELGESERAEWERWKASSPARSQAWARAQMLQSRMGGLPQALAMSVLDRPSNPDRRAAIVKLALLLAVLPTGWGGWELSRRQQWTADYRSTVGERRELTLADGSNVTLNTDTAIDVLFDAEQRLIRLRAGEIMVQTAVDPAARPFLVATAQGSMQALGTRFSVREHQSRTHLAVLEGAVKVVLADNRQTQPMVINAGQRTDFSAQTFGSVAVADRNVGAWTQGMLMADKMRLADFAAELARYRRGFVRCDPAIAALPVSGAYPISETSRTLNMLTQTYGIKVSGHLGGLWITLSPG